MRRKKLPAFSLLSGSSSLGFCNDTELLPCVKCLIVMSFILYWITLTRKKEFMLTYWSHFFPVHLLNDLKRKKQLCRSRNRLLSHSIWSSTSSQLLLHPLLERITDKLESGPLNTALVGWICLLPHRTIARMKKLSVQKTERRRRGFVIFLKNFR